MGPEKITPEVFEKLVRLAALDLLPNEAEYLREELNHQLAAVKELSEIPLPDDAPIMPHGIEIQGAEPRADVVHSFPDPEAIIALAPESEDRLIVVPDVAKIGGKA